MSLPVVAASQQRGHASSPRVVPCVSTHHTAHTHAHTRTLVSDLGSSCSPLPRLPMMSFSMTMVLSPLVMMPWPLLS